MGVWRRDDGGDRNKFLSVVGIEYVNGNMVGADAASVTCMGLCNSNKVLSASGEKWAMSSNWKVLEDVVACGERIIEGVSICNDV